MTAATLTRLPLAAGGTLVGSLGRGGFWTFARLLDAGFWGAAQFMRAPIAISAIAAIAGFSILAGSNALYFQHERHPAPLFFPPVKEAVVLRPAAKPLPVLPAHRPRLLPTAFDTETTGSINRDATAPIASTDITAMQMKLTALKLFAGTPDGIFGPRTATAVRAFQASAKLRADGRLTPSLLTAIRSAPLPSPQALAAAQAIATAVPTTPTGPIAPVPLAPLAAALAPVAAAPAIASAPAVAAAVPAPATPVPTATDTALPSVIAAALPATDVPAATTPPPTTDTFSANSLPADPNASVPPQAVAAPVDAATPADAATASLSAAQRLAAQMGTVPPDAAAEAAIADPSGTDDSQGSTDPVLITKVQRGLASLGFLADKIDGVPGEGTAKAIRNFEVFYNYRITGLATHQLLGLLLQHGATI